MQYIILVLLLVFHLFLLLNLQFTAWPEMLSYPYLHNNGYLLYKDMVHPYPPVLTLVLSYLFRFTGYSEIVLKSLTWSIILFSSFLVWLLAKKITKSEWAAIFSLAIYSISQPLLEGNMLWPDIAIVPPLLLGTIFLIDKKYFWAGTFFALSGFVKQTGGLFYIAVLLYLLAHKPRFKDIKAYLIGPFLFAVPLFVRLLQEGAVQGFINWVIVYPSLYWSKFPGYVQFVLTKSQYLITCLLLVPNLFLLYKHKSKEAKILLLFSVLSLISVYPRFSFFHLQSLIAFSAVAYGFAFSFKNYRPVTLILLVVLLWRIVPGARYEWQKETRFLEESDGQLASKISQEISPGSTNFFQGLNSSQYVNTKTLPPKPWLDNFGWYWEVPGVQEVVLVRWEQNPPQTIFWRKPSSGNWYDLGAYQPKGVVDYIKENYKYEKDLNKDIEIWRRR